MHLSAYAPPPVHTLPKLDITSKIFSVMTPEMRELLQDLEEAEEESTPVVRGWVKLCLRQKHW